MNLLKNILYFTKTKNIGKNIQQLTYDILNDNNDEEEEEEDIDDEEDNDDNNNDNDNDISVIKFV